MPQGPPEPEETDPFQETRDAMRLGQPRPCDRFWVGGACWRSSFLVLVVAGQESSLLGMDKV